ncbi:MAG: lipoyl(octanoyl) transferase LipB [Spirochaetales bacterium]|uniref:Octanoyltransferase n=1 Tax=Candidatus Thalassospirochaeta sargassi TaxID=3119039 RepID=A0AAJ1IH22_9SPIO|nr:lipoyl(octanoyl) transferase LipB [Spirochaetales bacterium]
MIYLVMIINLVDLGRMSYGQALKIQKAAVDSVREGIIDGTFFLVEHPPVLTMGRRAERSNILASNDVLKSEGVELFDIERGGDVTYHGPGQIVGYPVLDLTKFDKDLHKYVADIEEVFVRLLHNEYGIETKKDKGKYTGVYIDNRKITAIGIAVRKWISFHGFAFNVSTNLKHFDWIIPCGLSDRSVTSLELETGLSQNFSRVKKLTAEYFEKVFGVELTERKLEEIYNEQN